MQEPRKMKRLLTDEELKVFLKLKEENSKKADKYIEKLDLFYE